MAPCHLSTEDFKDYYPDGKRWVSKVTGPPEISSRLARASRLQPLGAEQAPALRPELRPCHPLGKGV